MKHTFILLTALLLAPPAALFATEQVPRFVAKQQSVEILATSSETPDRPYLAFPAIVDLGTEVLVSFKHGRAHAGDADAPLEWLHFDKASSRTQPQGTLNKQTWFAILAEGIEASFTRIDANKDRKLDAPEYRRISKMGGHSEQHFKRADANTGSLNQRSVRVTISTPH